MCDFTEVIFMQFLELPILIMLPFVGAFFLLLVNGDENRIKENSYYVGTLISISTFFASIYLCRKTYLLKDDINLFSVYSLKSFNISLKLGMNLLTSIFTNIISFLTVLSVFLSKKSIKSHIREYIFLILLLEFSFFCCFCTRDIFVFFIFFFCVSFILFFQISFWGIEKRVNTANKFILYSLLGNVCLLTAFFIIYQHLGASDFDTLKKALLPEMSRKLILILFVGAAFFFFPVFPVHLGLMDCFTEAPSPTRILISGGYTKLMLYFFIQVGIPIIGNDFINYGDFLINILCISMFLASIMTLNNKDIRKFTGSLHLVQNTLLMIGFVCLTMESLKGCLYFVFSQAISMPIFLIAMGAYYEKFGYSFSETNLLKKYPVLSSLIFLSGLNLLGFPPLPNFLGQFLILQSCFKEHPVTSFFTYMSIMFLFVSFYKIFAPILLEKEKKLEEDGEDLNLYERVSSLAVISGIIYLTINPECFFCLIRRVIDPLFE